jgi:tetrahydromethanopterin S-methyltransferase subunit E
MAASVRHTLQLCACVLAIIGSSFIIYLVMARLYDILRLFSQWFADQFLQHSSPIATVGVILEVVSLSWVFVKKLRREGLL